ncbi:MAG: hypothetical protein M1823_006385 [Watsoniomyces obsoletus]|nr:MAG: hypothetical protein M1823_006385 [Watsoniomyces obsoletus]
MEEEERELDADELAAEVERLEASNREVRLRQRYKALRQEQRALNTPLTSPHSIHRRSVTPARRPRSDSDDAPVDREHKRRMDIESKYAISSPEPFAGGTMADYRRFERGCEIVFETRPSHYEDEKRKILFARGFLRGSPADAWARLVLSEKPPIVEWTAFKDWLRNETQPDGMRRMEASRRYREASQQTRQRVADYISDLDGLEEDIEALPEHVRKDALLMGLRPEIKVKIMETLSPPTTRQQVADLATLMEEARNQAARAIGGERSHADGGPRPYRQRADRGRPIAPSRPIPMQDVARPPYAGVNAPLRGPRGRGSGMIQCYGCRQFGHKSLECTQGADVGPTHPKA